jgi:hypothetical protein
MKTNIIVQQYITECASVALPPGLGDFLRGCIYLYQQSKIYNFTLIVDFSKHPLGKYIKPYHNFPINNNINDVLECFNENYYKVSEIINNMTNLENSVQYLITSIPYDTITNDDINFMKNILLFDKEIYTKCDEIKKELDIISFDILQLRMGDHQCNNITFDVATYLEPYINDKLVSNKSKSLIILSDSYSAKKYYGDKYNFKYTYFKPVHLGSCSENFKLPEQSYKFSPNELASYDSILNTLVELVLMSQAKTIHHYSIYSLLSNQPPEWRHCSSFIRICSDIYNIPLVLI